MMKQEKVSFEEALNITGFGRYNLSSFLLCCSIIAGMVFEIFSVGYLVPASACELMTTSEQQGLMAAAPLVGIIVTSHFWGYLADTRGRKKVLCLAMVLACVCGALAAFSPNWWSFIFFKFLSASSVSGSFALAITLLSETTPEDKRFVLLVFTSTVFFFCNGLMALMTIPVLPLTFSYYIPVLDIHFNSWRLLNLIFTVPSAFALIGLLFAYESPKYLLSIGRDEDALSILRNMYAINHKKSGDEFPVKSVTFDEERNSPTTGFWSSMWSQTVPLFKPPLLKNTILISGLFLIVYICLNPFMTWLPYINDMVMSSVERGELNMTFCQRIEASQNYSTSIVQEEHACTLNKFAMMMIFTIGTFLATFNALITVIVRFVGRKALFISLQMLSGVAALLVNVSSNWMVGAVFLLIFLSGILNFGFLSTFSVEVFPTYVKAMAVCVTLMVGRGSAFFGVNLLKQMLQSSCTSAFYISGAITLVGGILGFLLPAAKKPTQRKCPET